MARNLAGIELFQGALPLTELSSNAFSVSATLASDRPVRGVLTYGFLGGPESGSLLRYHALGAPNLGVLDEPQGGRMEILALDEGAFIALRVLFDGRPAAGAEVVFTDEGNLEKPILETDAEGALRVPKPEFGPLVLRAKVVETPQGLIHEGRAVEEVLHYATLAVQLAYLGKHHFGKFFFVLPGVHVLFL